MFKSRRFSSFLLFIALGFTLCFSAAAPSQAADNMQDGEEFITFLGNKFINALMAPNISHNTRLKRFHPLLDNYFDIPRMAKLALGKYWRKATDAEKSEYVKTLKEYVAQSYAVRFAEYNNPAFNVLGTSTKEMKNKDVFVATKISVEQIKEPVRIDWRLKPQKAGEASKFRIVDVVVEGVSMIVSQRSEFSAVIQRNGGTVRSLIDTLAKKTENIKAKS
ncbi:MAG: MlaC/ttg2D family ABC transporter substrate-binding protein [Alphaproteobacteria bacterium]